jgi:hypothetical protein
MNADPPIRPLVWLALVSRSSPEIGYVVEAYKDEMQSWRNWCKRRSQRLLGEFSSERHARDYLERWLDRDPIIIENSRSRMRDRKFAQLTLTDRRDRTSEHQAHIAR